MGVTNCVACGAVVAWRKSAKGRAYYSCRGEDDERACGTMVTLGARPSRQLLEGVATPPAPAPANTPEAPQPTPSRPKPTPRAPRRSAPASSEAVRDTGARRNPFALVE